ncbi:MBL fold metallo-hydrolase [Clostridium sp. MB40-C1]|uniref:MBL fold metallo-hydrolase n=1 Tax=Clostridium sp. MB40-C1 TaxID=3070996 RepID=UPI0027E1073E|nr:MBL fold metallo-hydrolase [Clostridium sp. MB40-C1]WMJ81752.1 MBL fold metallo-hydrolase [Clostridium sp. MB40-C1]
MKIKKVKGSTFCIDTGRTYIPFYKINDEEIIMLDSGLAEGERKGIDKILEENNFNVAAIICSHAHIDHIGNIKYLKNKYNCTIVMPTYEAFVCSSIINLKVYRSSSNTLPYVKEHFGHLVCKTDIMISDNQDSIYVCGIKFEILHTPGHSPAHICIVTPDNVAYVADALISYEVMKDAKMPYVFMLKEDLKSKEKLRSLERSKYIVAHKGIYDDITNLITDNIAFYKNIAKNLYNLINDSMTMEQIVKVAIKNCNINVKSIYKYSIMETIVKSYIEYLIEIEMIESMVEDGSLKYIKKCPYNNIKISC